jgi:hypothetical protein
VRKFLGFLLPQKPNENNKKLSSHAHQRLASELEGTFLDENSRKFNFSFRLFSPLPRKRRSTFSLACVGRSTLATRVDIMCWAKRKKKKGKKESKVIHHCGAYADARGFISPRSSRKSRAESDTVGLN